MQILVSFSDDFDRLYSQVERDYPDCLSYLGISQDHLDYSKRSKEHFVKPSVDFSIDKNANTNNKRDLASYTNELTKPLFKLHGYFLMWKMCRKLFGPDRARHLLNRVLLGDFYFHDASGPLVQVPYCVSFSTLRIAAEGMPYDAPPVPKPPKHLDSFAGQVVETMFNLGNTVAGAVAAPDFLVTLSFYTKGVPDKEVRQVLQSVLYKLNRNMRTGGFQSLFSNLSVYDKVHYKSTFKNYSLNGETLNWREVDRVQRIFAELVSEGVDGVPYRFPVLTANVSNDLSDERFLDSLAEWNTPLGVWNIYCDTAAKLSMCCRLSLDLESLPRLNAFGAGDIGTGSLRVVTLNLPRLALQASSFTDFFDKLSEAANDCCDVLYAHRQLIEERIRQNFLWPFTYKYLSTKRMFSTIGINGLYEASSRLARMDGYKLYEVMHKTLSCLNEISKSRSQRDEVFYNVEMIPAEQAAFTLAGMDRYLFGDFYEVEGYSNQLLPLSLDVSLRERIEMTGKLDKLLSGGGILHINTGERLDAQQMRKVVKFAARHTTYFAVNYVISQCSVCGSTYVGTDFCPKCGSTKAQRMTRVVGYFSPLRAWSSERLREYTTRKVYYGGNGHASAFE
ncbi:hypothetical protein DRO59_08975 [Candidatus Bathyarchaeota archaeon]|nr:MAG: hypothetical protein DRO59_08975 [Candidatus Bathyarchaeota archaeon]